MHTGSSPCEACYSREGVMYFIWIFVGLPIASLLCAAFIAMRDGKVAPARAAVRRAPSASRITPLSKVAEGSDWSSERTVQVLIGILSNPSDDGFRVTIRQFGGEQESKSLAKSDDKASTRLKSEVWTLKRSYDSRESETTQPNVDPGTSVRPT